MIVVVEIGDVASEQTAGKGVEVEEEDSMDSLRALFSFSVRRARNIS